MSLKFLSISAFCLTLVLGFTSAPTNAEDGVPIRRALVIGIDGTRPDALHKAKTPNLDALIADGSFADTTQILGERYQKNDTISGPGWSSFLTGVWADKHGVHDNSFKGRNYEEFPHFFHYVKERYPQAMTASFVNWLPIDEYIVSDADIRKTYKASGATGYLEQDVEVGKDAAQLLKEGDPHVVVAYFGGIDETGHTYGFHPSVKEYISAIEATDANIGRVLDALKARPNFAKEDWLIVVSTDHGGQGLNHSKGHQVDEIRTTFLIVSGAAAQKGTLEEQTYVVDVPATVLKHLGIEIDPKWKLDGQPRGLK